MASSALPAASFKPNRMSEAAVGIRVIRAGLTAGREGADGGFLLLFPLLLVAPRGLPCCPRPRATGLPPEPRPKLGPGAPPPRPPPRRLPRLGDCVNILLAGMNFREDCVLKREENLQAGCKRKEKGLSRRCATGGGFLKPLRWLQMDIQGNVCDRKRPGCDPGKAAGNSKFLQSLFVEKLSLFFAEKFRSGAASAAA